MSTAQLRGGRARLDELLAATIDVLRETGYDRLTIDAVVARARASKATVYRRWPNKAALVVAAFTRAVQHTPDPPETGSLRGDLLAALGGLMSELDRLGDVVTGLVGELRRSPDLADAMRSGFIAARREAMMLVFDRARRRGELTGDALLDTLWYLGPALVFFRTVLLGEPVDDGFLRHVVDDLVLPLLHPRVPAGGAGYPAAMTATPFGPGAHSGEQDIPAADAGRGAPEASPGFGVDGDQDTAPEQPDNSEQPDRPEKPDHPDEPDDPELPRSGN